MDKVFGFPSLVRFSWETTAKLLEKHCVDVNFYEPEGEAYDRNKWKKKKDDEPEEDFDDLLGEPVKRLCSPVERTHAKRLEDGDDWRMLATSRIAAQSNCL